MANPTDDERPVNPGEESRRSHSDGGALSKPPHRRLQAVALQYLEGDKAPRIVASGAGELARRILLLAEQHNVPVKRDDSLVSLLSRLDLGHEIPAEAYRAVAEILAFLYRTDEEWRKRKAENNPSMGKPKSAESAKPASDAGDLSTSDNKDA